MPVAPSTAHSRGSNSAAQHNSRSRCRRSARTNNSPTSRSSPSIATAVCEPLCGIDPNDEHVSSSPRKWNTAAGTPDAGMPFLFRATPQHGNRRMASSLGSQPESGRALSRPPAGTLDATKPPQRVTPTQPSGQHAVRLMQVSRLQAEDVSLVATIDRSEHVDVQYCVIDGELQQIPAAITEVAAWDPTGSGPHSVTAKIAFCESVVARGGILLGAFDGGEQQVSRSSTRRLSRYSLGWRSSTSLGPTAEEVRRRLSGTLPPTSPWRTAQSRSTSLRHRQNPRLASISDKVVAWRIRSPGSVRRGAGRHSSRSITEVIAERRAPICAPRKPSTFWRYANPTT